MARFVVVDRDDARVRGEPQRKRPDAGEQIGDRFWRRRMQIERRAATAPPRLPPSPARTRPAAAARSRRPCAASARAAARSIRRGGSGARGWLLRGDARQRCRQLAAVSGPEPRTSTSRPASVAVTWMSSGFLADPSTSAMAQAAGSAPSRLLARTGQRSIGDQLMRARGREADFEHVLGAAPRMEHDAAAAVAVRVDQLADRRLDAGLPQRFDDEVALPGAVGARSSQCCNAQPPQTPKCGQIGAMRSALGFSTLRRCRRSGWPGTGFDFDGLARQRAGHVDRALGAVGDAVAAMAEPVDRQDAQPRSASMKNSRLPSPPRIADGTMPPTRQPSDVTKAAMSSQIAA